MRDPFTEFHAILIAVDGWPASDRAVRTGIVLAAALDARPVFCHVAAEDDAARSAGETVLAVAVERAREAGLAAIAALVDGATADALLRVAAQEDAGLIVVGNAGRPTLESLFLGSVSAELLRRSPVPVVVTRADMPARLEPSAHRRSALR